MEPIFRKEFAPIDRAEVQDQTIRAVESDPEPFIAAYRAAPFNFGGRYVSADAFKDTFDDFKRSQEARNRYNAPVHNAAAVLASEQFRRALRDDSDPRRDTAIFLTGIPGAGKTSAVIGAGFPANARVIFEGQLNRPEPTIQKIRAALDAGLKPAIVAVHVTPELALQRTFQRFDEYGRGASIHVMADIQGGLPAGLRTINERFGDAVELTILDNRFPGQHKALHGWHHLTQLEHEGNHERIAQRLRAELERHREEGRISDACYRQANGDAPIARSIVFDRGMDRDGGRQDQRNGDQRSRTAGSREEADLARSARPPRALAFERMDQTEALRRHPELKGAYRELVQAQQLLAARSSEARAVQLALARESIQHRLDAGKIPPLSPALPLPTPMSLNRQHPQRDR
ncbi:zeta toxin family protein [Variovorax sp. KK3]|uniref:zeta toxin family protein n=1 Tax=Variovorax sp. KK3 TaxID=1855728 RepID=UPI00117C2C94|nr:zeta toxin family protein [Variovorax sp. KK3]